MLSKSTAVKSEPTLKIGFILDGGLEKPDGVQQYILGLGDYFMSRGHQVRYLVSGKISPGINNAISLSRSIRVSSNGNQLTIPLPAGNRKLKQCLSSEQFDVLHVQAPYSPALGERLILLADKQTAIIGTFHVVPRSIVLDVGDWLLGKWCYFSIKHFDKMVSVSPAAQVIAARDYGISSEVLPNVINYARLNKAKPLANLKSNELTILFFGRLVKRKGCQVLLSAINEIKNDHNLPPFRVIICGDGPLRGHLEEFCVDNELNDIVKFKGFIEEDDKPSYYAAADIAVFPSQGGESFGIVLIEAMAAKTAVLAGDNVGYRSVMSQQRELLFNPSDSHELAKKLKWLMKDKPSRVKVASWGEAYTKQFDARVVGNNLLGIYRRALLNRRSL